MTVRRRFAQKRKHKKNKKTTFCIDSTSPDAYKPQRCLEISPKCLCLFLGLLWFSIFTHHLISLSRVVILAHNELYHCNSLLHLQAVFCWFTSKCTSAPHTVWHGVFGCVSARVCVCVYCLACCTDSTDKSFSPEA